MESRYSRFLVQLTGYEAHLFNLMLRHARERARSRREREPTKNELVAGCIRITAQIVFGQDFGVPEFLGKPALERIEHDVLSGAIEPGRESTGSLELSYLEPLEGGPREAARQPVRRLTRKLRRRQHGRDSGEEI